MATKAKTKTTSTTWTVPDRLADLKIATKVIGDTHAARLAWIVRFVREDPAMWHSATRASHGDCLVALGQGGYPVNVEEVNHVPPPLEPAQITALHAELRTALRALVSGGGARAFAVPFETEGGITELVRLTGVGVRPAQFTRFYADADARSAVLRAVANLLEWAGGPLIACPVCKDPLVIVRKQRFCSAKCAQKMRNDRKAARKSRTKVTR
jgi:predicted nucleic acid-binding Zn ribbon protein